MNMLIPLLGLGAVGLMAMRRKAPAASNLSTQTDFTQVTGESGTLYAVAMGEPSDAGQVVSVSNTDFKPLFTYIALPNGGKHFMGSAVGAEPGELAKALADFDIQQP